jgi:hypothetical protein
LVSFSAKNHLIEKAMWEIFTCAAKNLTCCNRTKSWLTFVGTNSQIVTNLISKAQICAMFLSFGVSELFDSGSYFKTREPGWLSGIALCYGLDCQGFESRQGLWIFLFNHRVQNSSGAKPASYPMVARGFFAGSKAAGAWIWPLASI